MSFSFLRDSAYWFRVISLGLAIGFSIQFVSAWVAPTSSAPGGNVSGPITTGNSGQIKTSNLAINAGWDTNSDGVADTWGANGLLVPNGKVGIGDSTPDGTLKLDVEGRVGATEYCDQNGANCKSITSMSGSTWTISRYFIDRSSSPHLGTSKAMGKIGGPTTLWTSYTNRIYNMGAHSACFLGGVNTSLENHSCVIDFSGPSNWTLRSNGYGDDTVTFCLATCIN